MKKLGTKNIEAIANNIVELVKVGKKVASDKRVNLDDLPYVIALLPKLPGIIEDFKALGEAVEEGKDIEVDEIVHLIQFVHKKIKEIEAA